VKANTIKKDNNKKLGPEVNHRGKYVCIKPHHQKFIKFSLPLTKHHTRKMYFVLNCRTKS
jgi:hypothetical protein